MSSEKEPSSWKRWLWLSPGEGLAVGGILLIALMGLVARHLYLRSEKAVEIEPPAVEEVQAFQ